MNGNTPIFGSEEEARANIHFLNWKEREEKYQQVKSGKKHSTHNPGVGDTVFWAPTQEWIMDNKTTEWNGNVRHGDLIPALITRYFPDIGYANLTVFLDNGVGSGAFQVFSQPFICRVPKD